MLTVAKRNLLRAWSFACKFVFCIANSWIICFCPFFNKLFLEIASFSYGCLFCFCVTTYTNVCRHLNKVGLGVLSVPPSVKMALFVAYLQVIFHYANRGFSNIVSIWKPIMWSIRQVCTSELHRRTFLKLTFINTRSLTCFQSDDT